MSECIRILGAFEGVSGGSKNCVIPIDTDQDANESVVVIAAQVSFAKATSTMASMNAATDSKGNTYLVTPTTTGFVLGAIRANLGGGSDNDGMQLGQTGIGNDTSTPLDLEEGDTITVTFGPGETPDGYTAIVLGIPLKAAGNPGVVARSWDPAGSSSAFNSYGGLSTTQGNATLLYATEVAQPEVNFPALPAGIDRGWALCAAASMGGEVVPASPDAIDIASLNYNDQLFMQVWVILDLEDSEQFEPGASSFSGDANVLNFQLGTTTDVPGSPSPCPTGTPMRFGESGPWRFLVTDLESQTAALLDRLASNRQIVFTLNEPCRMSGTVPSDNPEVNRLYDDDPLLAEGNRLLYCFRRENDEATSDAPIWVIRAAGLIMNVNDVGGPDVAETSFEAFDPWQLLYRRPLRDDEGNLPGEGGLTFADPPVPSSEIAEQIIAFSELVDGTTHLDLLTGTIETTDAIEITFQQGMSVGEALDQLCATGTMDILIDPVYDPIGKPGIVGQLNIFVKAGTTRTAAIFAWDKPGRSLVNLNRQTDGRERANKIQYYAGQGGPPVALVSFGLSAIKYGHYWEQQFFPGSEDADVVLGFANLQGQQRRNGLVTYTISPAPERSPVPITGYYLGDYVPIYGSSRLRAAVATTKRVYSIPLMIGDDQMEAPAGVIVADDETPE